MHRLVHIVFSILVILPVSGFSQSIEPGATPWLQRNENLRQVEMKRAQGAARSSVELTQEQIIFQQLAPEMQNSMGLLYVPKEKFFVKKHFLKATYEYPPELIHFIAANIAVTYGRCFGLNVRESVYKASVTEPVCIQELVEMISNPLFYGGFYAFMVGNRYATPAAMNMFKKLAENKVKRGRKPMPLSKAQMWSGQLGMAFGFMLDQSFHKIMENKMLHQCAGEVVKGITTNKETLSSSDIAKSKKEVGVSLLNDDKKYCLRAYRELLTSSMGKDQLSSGMGGLLGAAWINGKVTPKGLKGISYILKWSGNKAMTGLTELVSSNAAPWVIRMGALGGVKVGVAIAPHAGTVGHVLSKTTNLAMFLAISEIVAHFFDPAVKSMTGTIDFRGQIKDINKSLDRFSKDQFYQELKCPGTYEEGLVISATGLCSRVPGVAELRTFHNYQTAWRQNKILGNFNMAYYGWQTRWKNFHSLFTGTKDILREISKFREFESTGKIKSVEDKLENIDSLFEQRLTEAAEELNTDKDILREKIKALHADESQQAESSTESYLRFVYAQSAFGEDEYVSLKTFDPLNFKSPEEGEEEIKLDRMKVKIKKALVMARKEAFKKLSKKERQDYVLLKKKMRELRQKGEQDSRRYKRYERVKSEYNKEINKIENDIWLDHNVADLWFLGRGAKEAQSPLEQDERLTYDKAKSVFKDYYLKSKQSQLPYYEYDDELLLSYSLLVLKKLSNINPITPAKVKMAEALQDFSPTYKYSKELESFREGFATLAGYDFSTAGNEQNSLDQLDEKEESEKEKPFWGNTKLPFANADVYDYVLTQALCGKRKKIFTVNRDEGFSLEFQAPQLTDSTNYCERVAYLDNWHNQYNMSIKSSLFVDGTNSYSLGLAEAAIYDTTILDFMKDETSFVHWWNDEIFGRTAQLIKEQGENYYKMLEKRLFSEYDHDNRLALEQSVLGLQSEQNWEKGDMNSLESWFYHWLRDYVGHTTHSLFSEKYEYSNFKQSEDLLEAYASEFGVLSNYLYLTMKPLVLKEVLVEEQISALNPVSSLLPQALRLESQQKNDQLFYNSIKNIKSSFVDVLMSWDSVNYKKYQDSVKNVRDHLEMFSQLLLPVEEALAAVKVFQQREDRLVLYENPENYQVAGSLEAQRVLKMKPAMVIITQLDEMLTEIEDVRRKRMAESFEFNINDN